MNKTTALIVTGLAFLLVACGQGPSSHAGRKALTQVAHSVPVRLEIPKLNVDAKVEQVATNKNGQMGVPADYRNVAWYAPGVIPGDGGDAVISGHLDWLVNGKLTPAVFTDLGNLVKGDEIDVVDQDTVTLRFKVTDTRVLAYNANPAQAGIFAKDGPARVTLITCAGAFDQGLHQYNQRRAVTAELVDK
jgi:LPXTG-site transpeptidase (sortase) family protein